MRRCQASPACGELEEQEHRKEEHAIVEQAVRGEESGARVPAPGRRRKRETREAP